MSRLSTLDSSFLRIETPSAHMHVGWFSALELPRGAAQLDVDALIAQVASRLHLAPRFRQRVVDTPLSLAEPRWQDDPLFDVRRHITVADETPVSQSRLNELANEFLSRQLRRDRPLWKLLVVPRTNGRHAAIVGKVHHAMVDGIAAVELGMLLFDPAPDAQVAEPALWLPEPQGGPVRLLLDSVADSALEQFRAARQIASLGRSPGAGLRVADSVRRAAFSIAEDALRPAPPSRLNVAIGPRRRLVRHRVALDRLIGLKERYGVTLNDLVLAISAGTLRRFALRHGDEPRDLRAMVPVSLRAVGDAEGPGNRITFAFVELPVGEPSAATRLELVRARMAELKQSGRVAGTDLLLRSVGALPEPFKRRVAQLASSPRLYNVTISNVPGPRMPLYAAGARVRSIYPVIPIPDGHALSIGVLTYDEGVHFAVYADPDGLPRLGRLPMMLEDAIEELAIEGAPALPAVTPAASG